MVRITTEDGGIIDIELNEEVAPITCENFKKLVKEGFYNGMICKTSLDEANTSFAQGGVASVTNLEVDNFM